MEPHAFTSSFASGVVLRLVCEDNSVINLDVKLLADILLSVGRLTNRSRLVTLGEKLLAWEKEVGEL